MHEASIAQSIIGIAESECAKAGYGRITAISLRIGKASGVLAEALKSAFEIVSIETKAEGAGLVIDEIPLGGRCRGCSSDFVTDEQFILACPSCGSRDFTLDRGRELDIIDIEVE